jgi:glycosyltransferase involved in cell wall biosynthesis
MWGPELSRRVRLFGKVSEGMKNALLGHCDILAAPSLYESFGIVFLEAMRMGKPVIGTSVGGIGEIVVPGETGLLVPPQDPAALADAMVALARDARARERLGRAGLDRFLRRFSTEEFARRSTAFYEQVIAHWHGSRFAADQPDRAGSKAA